MTEVSQPVAPGEIVAFTARGRDLAVRLARLERVDQAELDAFEADKDRLLCRIEEARS